MHGWHIPPMWCTPLGKSYKFDARERGLLVEALATAAHFHPGETGRSLRGLLAVAATATHFMR